LPTTNSRPALTSEFRNCGLLVSPNGFERLDHVARTILDDTARGRIVLVSFEVEGPDRNGGVGTAVGALAERLAQAGHDVHIVYCPYSEHGLHEMWVDYWEARGVSFHVVRRFDDDGRFRWFRQASTAVADLVESLAPDVAHFVDCDALGAVAAVRRSARRSLEHTRIITTTHGSVLWVSSHAGESLRDQEVAITEGFSRLLRHSDLVCHPSQYMRDWVGERFEEPSRVVVVPNCLSGMKRSFSTTDPNPRAVSEIVLFGRLDPVKGLDRFARAIRLLWDEPDCPPFSVTLMGRIVDEDMRRYIEDLFGGVPCTTSLRFLTNYDSAEAQNHLRTRPCVAVVPSVLDNLPYTVYECLDGSIPVITSSVGGIPELVHPDDRSRVLVADSAASLAEALQDALRLGGAPARLAFDPIDIDVQQINLHEQLVADARRGRRPGEFGWQTRLTIAERARSELYLLRSRQEPELVRRVRMALRHRAKRLLTYLRGLST
jgi:glycosyltransferase involved in cell wall biosynthesis